MHGNNVSRPLEVNPDGKLQVAEIFYTIQGEGPYSGLPATFIRLSGCNLQCHFCDTVWDDKSDPYMTTLEITKKIVDSYLEVCPNSPIRYAPKLVVLTGGEPARQDCSSLVHRLVALGYYVQVETAGTYWKNWMMQTTIVCSPKTKHVHPLVMKNCDNWKYIIRSNEVSEDDGLPNKFTQLVDPDVAAEETFKILDDKFGCPARPPRRENVTVWVSPCDEGEGCDFQTLGNMGAVAAISMKYGYRAQVQVHKILNLR